MQSELRTHMHISSRILFSVRRESVCVGFLWWIRTMKKNICALLCLNLLLVSLLIQTNAAKSDNNNKNGVYIVYMGAQRNDHSQLLSSLMKREKSSVIYTYTNGFSGFAALLSEAEAKQVSTRPGVVSVFPDPVLRLHTTHSWDFLKYQTDQLIDSKPRSTEDALSTSSSGSDVIIGILDTGIWPESDSFVDTGLGEIPSTWKGKCMEGQNFTSSNCNKKLIGARYYPDANSPRDESGHGTHVASTAAGAPVPGASYYGLAKGTAQGGSTGSRIAMYRVCSSGGGCSGSAILKAFDDAIGDGVHILSLSLGSSPGAPDFSTDPVAIGAFHAVEKGIIVICSAGNSGPGPSTVTNVAPWILTVAATTIDRDLEADVVLGSGNKIVKGGGINFSTLNKSPVYPLIEGKSAKSNSTRYSDVDARKCNPGSLESDKVKGKIVLCSNEDQDYGTKTRFDVLQIQGAIGMIVIDDDGRQVPEKYGMRPISAVTKNDADEILSYINSTSNPVATILPTTTVQNYKPAPVVGYFSSRGPTFGIQNLLKPDITAPGVAILAAWPSNNKAEVLPEKEPPLYAILSGTSMSCPHVSGLAATVKSQHFNWSPAAIKSAIMTSAISTNRSHDPITTEAGLAATPYDIGAGEISLSGPLLPGLVYETETSDYILFLCNLGYDTDKIKNIASSVPDNFSCPVGSNSDLISDMNYPSIAVTGLKENESQTVNRTVTNVGEEDSVYTVVVQKPDKVDVEVRPSKLQFTKGVKKMSFQVVVKLIKDSEIDLFGSITWSNEKYRVRSPIVVSVS